MALFYSCFFTPATHGAVFLLDESLDIMRWAFEGGNQDAWWQTADTPANRALIALNDGPFKQQLDLSGWFDALPLKVTQQWLQGWLQSELFKACMKKLPTGPRVQF